ncbi:Glutamyl-Q tRNA(Asp) synthetase [uncultured Gammaproteobacteria bacterium]
MAVVTRFAPSPTGHLHLGHALSALTGWRVARAAGGRFLVRIEDIDRSRCRAEFEHDLLEDLAWLGLDWEQPVRRQSEHLHDYRAALDRLRALGVIYPCFCTRKDIQAEIAAADRAPHGQADGGDQPLYPGTCRGLPPEQRAERLTAGLPFTLRLDLAAARALTGPLIWSDRLAGTIEATPELLGDVVLARKDTPTSYHLSVVVDDARQGVTLVTRGQDLFFATHLHRLLQSLLDLPIPEYLHHPLLTNDQGVRLAKRDRALTLRALREAGQRPEQVRRMAGFE